MTYELGDTVTLTFTSPADATVVLNVTAPDGTESTPATSHLLTAWSASFTANQRGAWLYAWRASGTGSDVQLGSVNVESLYAPVSLLREALGLASTDTTRDDLLGLAMAGASRSVEKYCDGRVFTLDATATARTYALVRGRVLCTAMGDRAYVDDIGTTTGLVVEVGDGTTYTTITDIETHPDNALVRGDAITAIIATSTRLGAYRRLRVTARWGWPQIPAAVEQATLLQASRLYWRKDSPGGVAGSGEWGMIRVPNLDPDVKALLAPYKAGLLVA